MPPDWSGAGCFRWSKANRAARSQISGCRVNAWVVSLVPLFADVAGRRSDRRGSRNRQNENWHGQNAIESRSIEACESARVAERSMQQKQPQPCDRGPGHCESGSVLIVLLGPCACGGQSRSPLSQDGSRSDRSPRSVELHSHKPEAFSGLRH